MAIWCVVINVLACDEQRRTMVVHVSYRIGMKRQENERAPFGVRRLAGRATPSSSSWRQLQNSSLRVNGRREHETVKWPQFWSQFDPLRHVFSSWFQLWPPLLLICSVERDLTENSGLYLRTLTEHIFVVPQPN